jgi:predicted small lipoprotein YifL
MKTLIRALALTVALTFALTACGDKKDGDKKDEKKEEKKEEKKVEKDEALDDGPPKGPKAPPKPSFTDDQLKAFAVMDVPGFKRTMDGTTAMGNVAPLYVSEAKNENGAAVEVMTAVGNCVMCVENTAAKFAEDRDSTPERMWMSKAMLGNPDLVWEFGELEVDGRKLVTVHILSYVENKTDMGTSRSGTHQFSVHWNDGGRQIRAMASGKSVFPKSLEELKTKITEEELKAAALEVFKTFAAKL